MLFRRKKASAVTSQGWTGKSNCPDGEDLLDDLDEIERARHDLMLARLEALGQSAADSGATCDPVEPDRGAAAEPEALVAEGLPEAHDDAGGQGAGEVSSAGPAGADAGRMSAGCSRVASDASTESPTPQAQSGRSEPPSKLPEQPRRYNRHIQQGLDDNSSVSDLMRAIVAGDILAHRLHRKEAAE